MATLTERLQWIVDADVTKANKAFKSVGDTADKELGKAETKLDKLSGNMVKFGAGATAFAGVAVAGLAKTANAFEDTALSASKMADTTKLSVNQASRWNEVTGDMGISSGTLESALNKMNKTIGATPQVLSKYNIEVARTKDGNEDVQQTFLNVVDGLKGIPDAGTRAAAATAILGKGWTDLSRLVETGSDQLKKSIADVSDAKAISPAEAQSAKDYQASIDSLKDSFEDLQLSIGKGAAPVLGAVASAVGNIVSGFAKINDVTDGFAGRVATIAALGIGVAGVGSVIAGTAIKIVTNLTDAKDAIGKYATKLGVKAAAETVDATATEAAAVAGEGRVASVAAETVAVEANTVAVEANAVAQQELGLSSRVMGGGLLLGAASLGALAGEAVHAHAAAANLTGSIGELAKATTATATVDELNAAFTRFFNASLAAGSQIDQIGKFAASDVDGAQRLSDAIHSGAVAFDTSTEFGKKYIDTLDAAIAKQRAGTTAATDLSDATDVVSQNAAEGAGLLNGLTVATEKQTDANAARRIQEDYVADAAYAAATATDAEKKAAEDAATASDHLHDSLVKQKQAQQDLIDTERSAIDAKYADRKATGDAADAVGEYNLAQTDLDKAVDKAATAHRKYGDASKTTKKANDDAAASAKSFADATDRAFDAAVNKSEADVKAGGAALDSKAGVDGQIASLEAQASTLAPGSPLRSRLDEYIRDLKNIPTSINSNVNLTVTGAGVAVLQHKKGQISENARGTAYAPPGWSLVGEEGPELVRLRGGEQIFTAARSARMLSGMGNVPGYAGGAGFGGTYDPSQVSIIRTETASPAGPGAADTTVDDAIKEQDRLQAAMYKTRRISLDAYRQYVTSRQATSQDLSDDWLQQYDILEQLSATETQTNDDKAKSAQDAADAEAKAAADAIAAEYKRYQNMHDLGALSDTEWRAYLVSRAGNDEMYSDSYVEHMKAIKAVDDQAAADHQKALDDQLAADKKHYSDLQAIKDVADAEAAQADAVAALGGARGQDRVDANQKAATAIQNTVLAKAAAAGLTVGTVDWDRFVRALLGAAINNTAGSGIEQYLANYLSFIPALASGGYVPASSGGRIVRVGEGGQGEYVLTDAQMAAMRTPGHTYVTNVTQNFPAGVSGGDSVNAIRRYDRRNGTTGGQRQFRVAA